MKHFFILSVLLLSFVMLLGKEKKPEFKPPEQRRVGIGVLLGEPTALSFRYDMGRVHRIDFAAAWSLYNRKTFYLHSNYLFKWKNIVEMPEGDTVIYTGGGIRLGGTEDYNRSDVIYDTDDDMRLLLGVRAPGGFAYEINNFPLEVFLEAAIVVDILPHVRAGFNLALGLRFCF